MHVSGILIRIYCEDIYITSKTGFGGHNLYEFTKVGGELGPMAKVGVIGDLNDTEWVRGYASTVGSGGYRSKGSCGRFGHIG